MFKDTIMNLEYFKNKLEEEKKKLLVDLATVGQKNPEIPGDWEATPAEMDTRASEQSELADKFEQMENRSATEVHLEEKLNEVNAALEKIKNGTYGVCEVGGEKIDEDRLEANPAASTCVKHA